MSQRLLHFSTQQTILGKKYFKHAHTRARATLTLTHAHTQSTNATTNTTYTHVKLPKHMRTYAYNTHSCLHVNDVCYAISLYCSHNCLFSSFYTLIFFFLLFLIFFAYVACWMGRSKETNSAAGVCYFSGHTRHADHCGKSLLAQNCHFS